jgi:tol-pal system protein YbgF
MAALPPAFGAATAPNAADAGNAKQLYETAYGYLMQRDYSAAQGAFEDFLTRYPQDSLAGNAQYWLGEAHFVRGEYKAAAGSFLKGYQNYAGNARAADSLLKLAMSLDRLGQKDAACSSFGELSTRFPNAPENVKMRAKSERQRIGCT